MVKLVERRVQIGEYKSILQVQGWREKGYSQVPPSYSNDVVELLELEYEKKLQLYFLGRTLEREGGGAGTSFLGRPRGRGAGGGCCGRGGRPWRGGSCARTGSEERQGLSLLTETLSVLVPT